MSAPSLTKLTIKHLRGAVASFELPFEKGKKLTIVYGENGTGKSTICDALEFLGKGTVGSLDNRGLGKTNRYWNTVRKNPADVAVTLDVTAGVTCQAKIARGIVVAQPTEARPRVEVMRRSHILALMEARPGERYAAISRFIDVSGVEASEGTLRQLIRDLNSSRDIAAARIQENRDSILQFWDAAGRPGANPMAWAEAESTLAPRTADPELAALRALQAAYARLTDYPGRLTEAEKAIELARQDAATTQERAEECLRSVAQDAAETVSLLESARAYLHSHPNPTACPLCGSTDEAMGLAERIAQRLSAFSAFQQAQAESTRAGGAVRRAEQQRELLCENAARDAAAFEQACSGFAWSPDIALPATPAPTDIDALSDWLTATAELPARWSQIQTARQDRQQFLTTLKSALATYNENMQGQRELDILLPNLQRALEIVEEERKAFSDGILKNIASEVGRMYEAVHPGEGLNKISLELDATKRASLEIGTSFAGQAGLPPQAYFSQSHLDTLGLCVFLALAALDDPANTILVLDDVLASVDEPHVDRLIDMLYTETLKFRHCVITTHYGPWRHKLRWGWLKNGQCQFVELSRWTNDHGMTLIRSVPEVERLKALLAEYPVDTQSVCAKAGVILEAALDFLTQMYECSVPRRQGGLYTLGDLLPAIDKKLRQALCVEVFDVDSAGKPTYHSINLAPILDELTRIAQTRNVVGCHFNAISFDLLDDCALQFGQKVLELIEALVDPNAGWPRNNKSGMHWANVGETRRLHPFRQPS